MCIVGLKAAFIFCCIGICTEFEQPTRFFLKSFASCLSVSLAALQYDTHLSPSWGRAASEQQTVQSHKNDVNPSLLVSLLGTVVCDDLKGHVETSAFLLLNCMYLGVTQFSMFLPPNNCFLCHLKRLILSSLHPIIYSSCWWFIYLSALLHAETRCQTSQWRFWVSFRIKKRAKCVSYLVCQHFTTSHKTSLDAVGRSDVLWEMVYSDQQEENSCFYWQNGKITVDANV